MLNFYFCLLLYIILKLVRVLRHYTKKRKENIFMSVVVPLSFFVCFGGFETNVIVGCIRTRSTFSLKNVNFSWHNRRNTPCLTYVTMENCYF